MTATMRRGWLVAALVLAVAVLIGSILVAAAWSGNLGQGAANISRSDSGSVMMQSPRNDDDGAAMMGMMGRPGTSMQGRFHCAEFMHGRDG